MIVIVICCFVHFAYVDFRLLISQPFKQFSRTLCFQVTGNNDTGQKIIFITFSHKLTSTCRAYIYYKL